MGLAYGYGASRLATAMRVVLILAVRGHLTAARPGFITSAPLDADNAGLTTARAEDLDSDCRKPLPVTRIECDNRNWGEIHCMEQRARVSTVFPAMWSNQCTFVAPSSMLEGTYNCTFDSHLGRAKCLSKTHPEYTAQCRFTLFHCTFDAYQGTSDCETTFENLFEVGGKCAKPGIACPSDKLYYMEKIIQTNTTFSFGRARKVKTLERCKVWAEWKIQLLTGLVVSFTVLVLVAFLARKSRHWYNRYLNPKQMEQHKVVKILNELLTPPVSEAIRTEANDLYVNYRPGDEHTEPTVVNSLLDGRINPTNDSVSSLHANFALQRPRVSSFLSTVSSNDEPFSPNGSAQMRFLGRARAVQNSYQPEQSPRYVNTQPPGNEGKFPASALGRRSRSVRERPSESSETSFGNPSYQHAAAFANRDEGVLHESQSCATEEEVFLNAVTPTGPVLIANPTYL